MSTLSEEALPKDAKPTGVSETPVPRGGPRIVVNPTTFHNRKDALCVAYNEAFRVLMEASGFDPVSEPTEEQRGFFSDTAYAEDETQMRRTILARIATFDTSVKDPTPEQVEETVEFLHSVLEMGAPQNETEQRMVQWMIGRLEGAVGGGDIADGAGSGGPGAPAPQERTVD